jgi:3-oxoacyl-(acyl-carrier-protein) synthase III
MQYLGVLGTGYAVPPRRVGPGDFLRMGMPPELLAEWDVGEHREADAQTATDLEAEASNMAIARAGLTPLDIDLMIGSTLVPEKVMPTNVSLTQRKIGARNAAVFGVDMACIGAAPAIMAADALFRAGSYRNILVIGSCQMRAINDETDPAIYAVCGDGAGAVVLSSVGPAPGVLATHLEANGDHWENVGIEVKGLKCPTPDRADEPKLRFYIDHARSRDRDAFFEWAIASVPAAVHKLLDRERLSIDDIDWVCPHQNVKTVSSRWIEMLGIPSFKVVETRKVFGNMGPANVLVNLAHGAEAGKFRPGDKILLVGQGAGMSVGATLLSWSASSNPRPRVAATP